MTLPEANAAHEARLKNKGFHVTDGAVPSEGAFTPGGALNLDLNIPEQQEGLWFDPTTPEPLLRRLPRPHTGGA